MIFIDKKVRIHVWFVGTHFYLICIKIKKILWGKWLRESWLCVGIRVEYNSFYDFAKVFEIKKTSHKD